MVSGPGTGDFQLRIAVHQRHVRRARNLSIRLSASNSAGESSATHLVTVSDPPLDPGLFPDWQELTWPGVSDPSILGAGQDPDHDGLNNLLEWALHLDPKNPDSFKPHALKKRQRVRIHLHPPQNGPAAASFQVEWSDTLGNDWSASNVATAPPVAIDATTESVTATMPAGATTGRFARLRITAP